MQQATAPNRAQTIRQPGIPATLQGARNPAKAVIGIRPMSPMAVKSPNTLPSMERSVRTVRYENAALWNTPYPIMAMTKKKPENQIFWENVFAAYPTPYAPVIRHSVRKKPNRCEQPFVPRPANVPSRAATDRMTPASFSCAPKATIMNDSKMGTLSYNPSTITWKICNSVVVRSAKKRMSSPLSVGIPSPFSE